MCLFFILWKLLSLSRRTQDLVHSRTPPVVFPPLLSNEQRSMKSNRESDGRRARASCGVGRRLESERNFTSFLAWFGKRGREKNISSACACTRKFIAVRNIQVHKGRFLERSFFFFARALTPHRPLTQTQHFVTTPPPGADAAPPRASPLRPARRRRRPSHPHHTRPAPERTPPYAINQSWRARHVGQPARATQPMVQPLGARDDCGEGGIRRSHGRRGGPRRRWWRRQRRASLKDSRAPARAGTSQSRPLSGLSPNNNPPPHPAADSRLH